MHKQKWCRFEPKQGDVMQTGPPSALSTCRMFSYVCISLQFHFILKVCILLCTNEREAGQWQDHWAAAVHADQLLLKASLHHPAAAVTGIRRHPSFQKTGNLLWGTGPRKRLWLDSECCKFMSSLCACSDVKEIKNNWTLTERRDNISGPNFTLFHFSSMKDSEFQTLWIQKDSLSARISSLR